MYLLYTFSVGRFVTIVDDILGVKESGRNRLDKNNAPDKLFCTHPPRGSLGVRGKMCVIKKDGALEKRVFI